MVLEALKILTFGSLEASWELVWRTFKRHGYLVLGTLIVLIFHFQGTQKFQTFLPLHFIFSILRPPQSLASEDSRCLFLLLNPTHSSCFPSSNSHQKSSSNSQQLPISIHNPSKNVINKTFIQFKELNPTKNDLIITVSTFE
jgi:hypothetical protein